MGWFCLERKVVSGVPSHHPDQHGTSDPHTQLSLEMTTESWCITARRQLCIGEEVEQRERGRERPDTPPPLLLLPPPPSLSNVSWVAARAVLALMTGGVYYTDSGQLELT